MEQIFRTLRHTPWGLLQVEYCSDMLRSIAFTNTKIVQNEVDSAALRAFDSWLQTYVERTQIVYKGAMKLEGSLFRLRVWEELQTIPFGSTLSYSRLAQQIGHPGAVRAVASAVAANPFAILLPCHRIVPAAGGAGGYAWGEQRKVALLRHERAIEEV